MLPLAKRQRKHCKWDQIPWVSPKSVHYLCNEMLNFVNGPDDLAVSHRWQRTYLPRSLENGMLPSIPGRKRVQV